MIGYQISQPDYEDVVTLRQCGIVKTVQWGRRETLQAVMHVQTLD